MRTDLRAFQNEAVQKPTGNEEVLKLTQNLRADVDKIHKLAVDALTTAKEARELAAGASRGFLGALRDLSWVMSPADGDMQR